MVFNRKNINFLFVIILPLYFYIAQNSITNKHTHFYLNGMVVTHAHPVDKQEDHPINHHNHTKTEICFYASLYIDFYKNPVFTTVDFTQTQPSSNFLVSNEYTNYNALYLKIIPRGPPESAM
jgi:hypothetical protein